MGALPDGYTPPKSSGSYMKLVQGTNEFRILSPIKVGWEVWVDEDGKRRPVRSIKREELVEYQTAKNKIKFFWVMAVWNYNDEQVQVLEITQSNIRTPLEELEGNKKWGDLRGYDIAVKRTGEGLDTEYSVIPSPAEKVDAKILEEYKKMTINLDALYTGDNPFEGKPKDNGDEEIDPESLPF
jgi:hypothetical protein